MLIFIFCIATHEAIPFIFSHCLCRIVELFVMKSTVAMVFGDIQESDETIFAESARALWGAINEPTLLLMWGVCGGCTRSNKLAYLVTYTV